MAMSEEQLERWINQLIKDDQLYKFYKCKDWRELSEAIKKENNVVLPPPVGPIVNVCPTAAGLSDT